MAEPLLSIRGLTKAYPGVVANDAVSFDIGKGEIHALLGENGAGKSTLVKMIFGLVQPDRGEMTWDGAPFAPTKPSDARRTGVAMVFQHFSLFDALDVAENVALGMEEPPAMTQLARQIREVSETYGLPLDPTRTVGTLSAGERQRVEIIRCLLQNPRLLIMDEPTSVLTPQEVEILFETLNKLRAEGTSILYISHKLEEIRALCDTATILRLGKKVDTCIPRETTAREMAEMMVGSSFATPEARGVEKGPVLLETRGLSLPAPGAFGTPLRDIGFSVRAGEVLGLGGVAGNGQDELLAALSGERLAPEGSVFLKGADISRQGPVARRAAGLLSAPEERLGHAAAPDMSLLENGVLTAARRKGMLSRGFISWGKAKGFAEGGDRALRRAHAGGAHGGAGAVGRQPPEIRGGPRDHAGPRGAGDQPAHMGRGRGGGGLHPAADPRSGGQGQRGRGDQSGPRRTDGGLGPLRRAERGAAVGAAPGGGAGHGTDRPDDGWRA